MPRALWSLLDDRPRIQVVLTRAAGRQQFVRDLMADTGGGSARATFEMVLDENDCLMCGGKRLTSVQIGGSISRSFPIYRVRIQIPQLGFNGPVSVAGVPTSPSLDGIACFRFLNRFTYGNFGDHGQFGIEI